MDAQNISDTPDNQNREVDLPPPKMESALKTADNIDNVNVWKILDVNSADDVRSAIKATYGTMPSNYNDDDCVVLPKNPEQTNPFSSKDQGTKPDSKPASKPNSKPKAIPRRKLKRAGVRRGARQKTRLDLIKAMYTGKLSNVVPFKNMRYYGMRAESDSDVDSICFSSS